MNVNLDDGVEKVEEVDSLHYLACLPLHRQGSVGESAVRMSIGISAR